MDTININKKITKGVREIEISEDIIVPDTKQDLVSILDVNENSYLNRIDIDDGTINFSGNINSNIIYIASTQETKVLRNSFGFKDSIENDLIKPNMTIKYDITPLRSDVKILNERKIHINSVLKINYEVFEMEKIEIYDDFSTIEDLQMKSESKTIGSIIGINSSKTQIKEDIKVDNIDNIQEILKFDSQILKKEVKISYNKILAKTEIQVKIMYLTDDNRISIAEDIIPIMSFIDLENIKEDSKCDLDYQTRNIFLKINEQEEHSITCQMDFDVFCYAYEYKQINVVSDLYSLKYNVDFNLKEIETNDLNQGFSGKDVEIQEKIEINDIKNILEVEARSRILRNTVSGDKSNIEGEVELKIYYELNSMIGLNVKTIVVPFVEKETFAEEFYVSIISNEFNVSNNNVDFNLKLNIGAITISDSKISVIENVETKPILEDNNSSMVIYFVKPNDTIWNIAKMFHVSQDSIIGLNNIDNPDKILVGNKLYILK